MKYDVKDLENMDKNELIAKFLSLHESFYLELQEAKKQLQAEKIKSEKKEKPCILNVEIGGYLLILQIMCDRIKLTMLNLFSCFEGVIRL